MRWLAAVAVPVWLAGGCASAITPRPASTVGRGELTGAVHLSVPLAPGRIDLGPERRTIGAAAPLSAPSWWIALLQLASVELSLRGGIGEGCELGGLLGYVRVAAELRCAALAGDDPLALALAVAAGVSPAAGLHPWARVGADLGGGTDRTQGFGQIYLSASPETRFYGWARDASPWYRRDEIRLTAAVGVARAPSEAGASGLLAIAGRLTLHGGAAEVAPGRLGLAPTTDADVHQRAAVEVLGGVAFDGR